MKIRALYISNYRTLEKLHLEFPSFYAALSGKNNSGKTNVAKVIRSFFQDVDPNPFADVPEISIKSDYPNWKQGENGKRQIEFELDLLVHIEYDAGFYRFLTTFLGLTDKPQELTLSFGQRWSDKSDQISLKLGCEGELIEDEFKIEEVFKKLRSSRCLLFHNSTQQENQFLFRRRFAQLFGGLSAEENSQLKKANERMLKLLKKSAQRHQRDIIELLGRLEEKYYVTLSLPSLDFQDIPLMVSLGDKTSTVPLNDWGSGTQNRTQIFLQLLRAKKNREVSSESDRITPILLIEEPECFLHPSAQAEFGKMLQDLSEEFSVQVVTTTHSPYMLSLKNPSANLLLRRVSQKGKLLATERVETGGANWMEPFGLALGIDNESFAAWRNVLFRGSNQIILVEGDTDKAYLEMLRDSEHGADALQFDGEIFPYGGVGFFSNTILLKFIMSKFTRFVITFDLDQDQTVSRCLQNLGLRKNAHFFAVGIDVPGKRDVEGLLPDSVRATVYSKQADLVAVATSSEKQERESAKGQLKQLLLEEFRCRATKTSDYFGEFYKLTKLLNKAFR